tara:strand:+ start:428 stop:994 length:567 start_codon:yes stop_codon:yes gene_type:complete
MIHIRLFNALFLVLLPLIGLSQPQNLQTTTLINISYDNVSILGFGSQMPIQLTLPVTASTTSGINTGNVSLAASNTQYLQYTVFGSYSTTKSIAVSLNAPLNSDYYLIQVVVDPIGVPLFGSAPTNLSPVGLNTVPQTLLSNITYGATGSGPMDGISFHYRLIKNSIGSYSSLSGIGESIIVVYTITE